MRTNPEAVDAASDRRRRRRRWDFETIVFFLMEIHNTLTTQYVW